MIHHSLTSLSDMGADMSQLIEEEHVIVDNVWKMIAGLICM